MRLVIQFLMFGTVGIYLVLQNYITESLGFVIFSNSQEEFS